MIDRFQTQPLRIVHPGYSPDEGLWFTEDDVTARSLRELQAKLPDVLIEGYYPEGYTPARPARKRLPAEMLRPRVAVDHGSWYTRPAPRASTSMALPEREAGYAVEPEFEFEAPTISAAVEFKPIRMKRKYSRIGPERQPGSFPKVDWTVWEKPLRDKLAAGVSVIEIAATINCSRNAVIGRAHRLGLSISEERGTAKRKTTPRS
jgi:hypothetical protein